MRMNGSSDSLILEVNLQGEGQKKDTVKLIFPMTKVDDFEHTQQSNPVYPDNANIQDWVSVPVMKQVTTVACTTKALSKCTNQQGTKDDSHRRSEEHTSELQSLRHLVCRLLL